MHPNEYKRKLSEVAATLGFTMTPNGSGHITMKHTNGKQCSVASTPSEYRSWINTVSMLERLADQKMPRANHRRSRKKNEVSGYLDTKVTASHLEASERIAELQTEHKEIKVELFILASGPATRTEINRAAKLLRRVMKLEEVLTEMRQPFERYTPIPAIYTED